MFIAGIDGEFNLNSATWATPTWAEVTVIGDITTTLDKSTSDVKSRASVWVKKLSTTRTGTVEIVVPYDGANADFASLRDAFLNDTTVDAAVMDGDITVSGNQGLRAEFEVTKMERGEQLEDTVTVTFTLEPSGKSANEPLWFIVP